MVAEEVKFTKVQDAPVVRIKDVTIELLEVEEGGTALDDLNEYHNKEDV